MSFYLDTNVLVALLTPEPFSDRAHRFVAADPGIVIVSDFAAAEFSSVIARRVRTGKFALDEARITLAAFDTWSQRSSQRIELTPADVAAADATLRRLDLTLLTPDALHIAIARRTGATLATFDQRMAASARMLGMAVTTP